MSNPEIPRAQLETIQPILDPLLARLRAQADQLPPQADSALVYLLAYEQHEGGR
ncbi:MAG: hypothetical protein ABSE86_06430 [Bryobacteraceae bacterium]|jgi:hypothetical protein